jgi:CRP-like cAMP-binding protein
VGKKQRESNAAVVQSTEAVNPAEIRKAMHSLLRGLTAQQADQLTQASVRHKVRAGHALINEGDRPSGLVFLLQGRVEIFKHGPDGQRESLASIDAPTLVGEMSLITDRHASATVMTLAECEFQLLTCTQFQRLIAADSIAAYKLVMILAGVLAGRLRKLDRKVLELTGHWNL